MIEEAKVKKLVNNRIEGSDIFLVDVVTSKSNDIRVLVDSMDGVRVSECAVLSRWLEGELELLEENFSLEVSSPGLSAPLVMKQQYLKNMGRTVEVVLSDGKKKKGKLTGADDDGITLEVTEKMLTGGSQKKKKNVVVSKTFALDDIKSTKVVIEF
ncbi:MAG: ribosome assembly cofactor RimP [Bacteroidales bacterium]|nr:ribosome assembly cofactor RimP [Bacteroidales bacterium]